MFNQHFRTNEKLGALCSVENLLKVKLSGDDLTSFIHNWDAVIAGMSHVQEEITLKDIFLRELRKSTNMKHDLETYERAKDGTKEHTYHWLIQSVRDLPSRERTHKNRQQIARVHGDKFGAPAPNIPRRPNVSGGRGRSSCRDSGSGSRPPSGTHAPSGCGSARRYFMRFDGGMFRCTATTACSACHGKVYQFRRRVGVLAQAQRFGVPRLQTALCT